MHRSLGAYETAMRRPEACGHGNRVPRTSMRINRLLRRTNATRGRRPHRHRPLPSEDETLSVAGTRKTPSSRWLLKRRGWDSTTRQHQDWDSMLVWRRIPHCDPPLSPRLPWSRRTRRHQTRHRRFQQGFRTVIIDLDLDLWSIDIFYGILNQG